MSMTVKEKAPTTEVVISRNELGRNVIATKKVSRLHFVEKQFEFDTVQTSIKQAPEQPLFTRASKGLHHASQAGEAYRNIIGRSKPMQNIFEMIEAVAKSDANILIIGESGTGKELIANAIHYNSYRASGPYVKINCAALPKYIIESEIFGHARGAFTGAHSDKKGLIAQANGGSLLLDEIADMPLELQPKLMRALQEKAYYRLGSDTPTKVDFRLICATNRNPSDAVLNHQLREDLFYRISTITIEGPPLRERAEDVQLLADHFLKLFSEKYNKPIREFSQSAIQAMRNHNWSGNVRELQGVIERAVLLSKGDQIKASDLPFMTTSVPAIVSLQEFVLPPNMKLIDVEREAVVQALQRANGSKQAAANSLGIYRPRLYSLIKRHNLTEFM